MVRPDDTQELTLRFVDTHDPDSHRVSAGALAQSIEALQRLVNLLAMCHEGRTPGKRMRPSVDLQRRYRLNCALPQPGSYQLPVRLDGAELLGPSDADLVMKQLTTVLAAGSAGDASAFEVAVPDLTWQRFLLDAMERLPPQAHFGVNLTISQLDQPVCDTSRLREFTERLLRAQTNSERSALVGRLTEIDFEKHTVTLRHRGSGRELACVYQDAVEQSLLEHPRDLILVYGIVTRDIESRPISISEVDHIEPVDLSDIDLAPFLIDKVKVSAIQPMIISPEFDEDGVLYLAQIDSLGLSTFAESREMLESAIRDELAMLWREYARADDTQLTAAAQVLKQRLLDAFQEEIDAA